MYWHTVLQEVLNKTDQNYLFHFTPFGAVSERTSGATHYRSEKRGAYFLGHQFGSLYLTQREAECMAGLLQGETTRDVACRLTLSARTVEYYLKNIKIKLGCKTRSDLIRVVRASDFNQHSDKLLEESKIEPHKIAPRH